MPGWNFAAVWDGIAAAVPDRTAIVAGDRHVTWAELADRAHHLAWHLRHVASLVPGDRIAIALTNRPEYLEAFYATLVLRCVPVNVNYRYSTDEIRYVLDDSDAKVAIHTPDLAKTIRTAARRIPKPWRPRLLEVGEPYERAIANAAPPPDGPAGSPDGNDLIFLYTGGTTGMPKAVMWRNDDLYRGLWAATHPGRGDPPDPVAAAVAGKRSGTVLPVAPLMHGTGLFSAAATLAGSGTVVLLDAPRFDASLVWSAVERERVETLTIVGDAFARPLLAALDGDESHWDLSSLRAITSSGAVFSPEVKRGLLAHLPQVTVIDSLSASEGFGPRSSADADRDAPPAGRFSVNERISVLGEETMQPVLPGSGEIGLLAMTGFMPVGYWKDAPRTASTFRVVDGTRYVIPGDYATVEADGTVHLIGRGSSSINTGGEKVYPDEIETRLRKHASVEDCAVVGVPDPSFGEKIVALVVVTENHYIDEAELTAWCRTKLANYKAPKRFLFVDTLHRTASGKLDHGRLRELAIEILRTE